MKAIEFETTVRDDGSITIPSDLKPSVGKHVRVIVLTESQESIDSYTLPSFTATTLSTKGFKFSREYANER